MTKIDLVRAYSTSPKGNSLVVSIPARFRDALHITKNQTLVATFDEQKGQIIYQTIQDADLTKLVRK